MHIHRIGDVTVLNDYIEIPGLGFLPVNAYVLHAEQPVVIDTLTISGQRPAIRPDKTTLESFLLEQQWGFSRTRSGRLLRYEVEHPAWLVYPVGSYALDFDFAGVYGPEWGVLNGAEPRSLVLAAGSEVTISRPRRVRLTDEVEERRAKEHAD